MTKEQLAEMLNGREYGSEITKAEEREASTHRLVVVFGASDDNVEFRGAIDEEEFAFEGGTFLVSRVGVFDNDHSCNCPYCGFDKAKERGVLIEAEWNHKGYSWVISTKIPHAAFDIMEDGEKFCRGIVFSIADLPA